MVVSKSFDTHGPFGPWIVTTDEIGDPLDLQIRTYVNGDLRQDGLLATGTPSGIAWHHPGMYLKDGDTVRVEISKIGTLENPVVAESDASRTSS